MNKQEQDRKESDRTQKLIDELSDLIDSNRSKNHFEKTQEKLYKPVCDKYAKKDKQGIFSYIKQKIIKYKDKIETKVYMLLLGKGGHF